jgi:hypothetical protein
MSSRWQQIQAWKVPSTSFTTGSLTAVSSSPGNAGRGSASANPAGSSASSTSIHHDLLAGVPMQTHIRQRPSGSRTMAGRSIHWAPNRDWSRVATVVSVSPSGERATTV